MTSSKYDVAIVGYGPVGALTALELANVGLRVVVLERSGEPVVLPRAVGLDGESVRAFQRIGFGEEGRLASYGWISPVSSQRPRRSSRERFVVPSRQRTSAARAASSSGKPS